MRKIYTIAILLALSVGLVNAQTITIPHCEDFESFNTCATGCGASCVLANGWTNDLGDNLDWLTDISGTSSTNTGPTANGGADYFPGVSGGKYLYVETSCSGTGYPNRSAHLITPAIDLTGANCAQVDFYLHQYGTSQGVTHVDLSTNGGTSWTLDVIPTTTGDQGDQWHLRNVNLCAYSDSTVHLRIRHISGSSFSSDVAVDYFCFYDLLPNDAGVCSIDSPSTPACALDSNIVASIQNYGTDTMTTVNIEWSVNGVMQSTYAWTGSLAPGEKDTLINIGTYAVVPTDTLCIWTSLPNGQPEGLTGVGNDTMCTIINLGLMGTYSVGSSPSADYPTIQATVNDLATYGVCGPVIFELESETFNEQISFGEVIGANATNTITYTSAAGHIDSTLWTFMATVSNANWTINLDGADYFHFEDLTIQGTGGTYARVINVVGGANYNAFERNRIQSDIFNTTTSTNKVVIYSGPGGSIDNFNTFRGNSIEYGSYGMYWYGDGTTALEEGTVIEDNLFLNQWYYGTRLYYQDYTTFNGNTMRTSSGYTGTGYGFYFYYCDNETQVWGNTVEGGAHVPLYGIYMVNCDGANGREQWIGNNMVHVGDLTTSTFYGYYSSNNGYQNIVNNNFLVEGAGTNNRGIYITGGGANYAYNNCIHMTTGGYGLYYNSSFSVLGSDNNNVYNPFGNWGYFNGNQATQADFNTASNMDANSLTVNPNYISTTDLHVCNDSLDGMGMPIAEVTDDWDGQPRHATMPDIGADEFSVVGPGFLGADQALCTGDSIQLWAGSPADTVVWSTGDTTNSIWVSTPGSYSASVSGPCGSAMDTIDVTASALVYQDYISADTNVACDGDTINLWANQPYDTYSWTPGGQTTQSIAVTASGNYQLDVTDGCGSGSESILITFVSAPTASFTGSNSFLTCIFTNTSSAGGGNNSYSWDFGDGNNSTQENPVHVYGASGAYVVTLTVTNECGSDTYTDTCNVSTVGIADMGEGAPSIYPNPNNGSFKLGMSLDAAVDVKLEVFDLQGQKVFVKDLGERNGEISEEINLNSVATGTYYLKVQAGERIHVGRVIVK